MRILTKSDILRADRCVRLAFLHQNEPMEFDGGVFAAEGVAVEAFYLDVLGFTMGIHGEVFTVDTAAPVRDRAVQTSRLMDKPGAKVILQASFVSDEGVFVAVDALKVAIDGSCEIYEFKSSSTYRGSDKIDKKVANQYLDTLIQYRTLQRSGVVVTSAYLVRLDKKAISPDWDAFPVTTDITEFCEGEKDSPALTSLIGKARAASFSEDEVLNEVGSHCKVGIKCPFYDKCHSVLPEHGIHTLYKLMPKIRAALKADNLTEISQIPETFPLTGVALKQRYAIVKGKPYVSPDLPLALTAYKGNIAFIDFETFQTAVPKLDGFGPWVKIVFQVSCHVTDTKGEILKHHEWLADETHLSEDLMLKAAAKAIIDSCVGCDTVVSYNKAFESDRIKELADRVPSQKEELLSVTARMIDLLDTVQNNYYHQDFRGSLSIKSVLPVMVPSMAYEGMAVANGTDAIEAAREMLFGGHSKDLVDEIRANLLAYCGQDTLAMVEIFKKLQEIAKAV